MRRAVLPSFFALLAATSVAQAHVGLGDASGFHHGFMHPMSGIDHILAMILVGLFAVHLGGRAVWLAPLAFLAMMAVAGALGMAGAPLPHAEIGIALSVIVLGIMVASRANPPAVVAMGLVGFFAIFHGHAHGAEMPLAASGLEYGAGFVVATAMLHAIGIGLGAAAAGLGQAVGRRIVEAAGAAMASVGVAILAGYV